MVYSVIVEPNGKLNWSKLSCSLIWEDIKLAINEKFSIDPDTFEKAMDKYLENNKAKFTKAIE